ncbi:MAG: EAL domain-containing protein [Burkholderiales bacterium]|jgi:diguanylate cyclase (GGDEF)-like protein|nr:EAL domain-containing protein [Burkholderiales bacterium]
MMFLLRSSIGARLRLSYLVLLSLVLVLAAVGLNRLDHLSRALKDVVAEMTQGQARVESINANAEVAARKLLVLIGAPREGRVSAYAAIDAANERLDEAMRALAARSADDELAPDVKAAFADVEQRLADYRSRYAANVDLIEANNVDAARRQLSGDTEAALARLTEALARYSGAEQHALVARSQDVSALAVRDRQIVLGLCIASLLLGLVLAALITRGIVQPLEQTQQGAGRIAAGHYEHRITPCAVKEVDQLGESLNQLAAAVADREAARVHAAETDALTQFARQPRFLREGQALLSQLSHQGRQAMLACLDVDRLKPINALLGFEAGDALFQTLAQRLSAVAPTPAVFGRLSGGAIVALLPLGAQAAESDADAEQPALTSSLQQALELPAEWRGQSFDVSVTVGAAVYPADGAGPQAMGLLLRRAEAAMYAAKRLKVRSLRYDPTWESARASHLSLLSDLRQALAENQLVQVLQPKIDAASGALLGAEALVRWQHPQRGFMSPAEFIPFAESTGRIRDITRWMLRRAITNLAAWQAEGRPGYIGVNISTLDLADADLPAWLAAELAKAGVAPGRLQLEVTESGLMAAGRGPVEVMAALRAIGVSLAIDDFGTGQSSLAYLQKLPVDELKVDRSFVDRVDREPRRQALLQSIIDVGRSLGLTVTAEGVETPEELAVLRRCGADVLQGFLISRPLDEAAYAAWQPRALEAA